MKHTIALLLILMLAFGCATTSADIPATAAEDTAAATPAASADEPVEYAFTFSAQSLDGETVTESFFGQYDLVMVNVWASWCGPCRGELPELDVLCDKLPENVGFLSVTVDDPGDLQVARDLLAQNGCAFTCLDGLASEGLMNGFLRKVMAIPTTVFFDRSGNQVGEWIVGVPRSTGAVSDAYLAEIQARLDLLNGK